MKKSLMLVLALLISVAFVTTVFAQQTPTAPEKAAVPAEKPAKAKVMRFTGEVVSVDVAAKTLVAKNKRGEKTFDATNARFGKGVKLEDLKAGDKVSVKFKEKDGKNVATYVRKAAPKAKKAPAEPKEEKPAEQPATEPATK